MSIHVNVSGTWKTVASCHVNVSGTWKTCRQVYVKTGDAWHKCILITQSQTITLGTLTKDKTQSLSNVKKNTTIKITGNYVVSNDGTGGALYGLKATGATLPSNYGAYDASGWRFYQNLNGSYTLNLTATSTSVSITIRAPASYGSHTNCKITYTQEGYFD